MSEEFEKGFLANKFEDWSSEPIPNGWERINSIIETDREKPGRRPFWLILTGMLLVSGLLYLWLEYQQSLIADMVSSIENISEPKGEKPQKGLVSSLSKVDRPTFLARAETTKEGSDLKPMVNPTQTEEESMQTIQNPPNLDHGTRNLPFEWGNKGRSNLVIQNNQVVDNEKDAATLSDANERAQKVEQMILPNQQLIGGVLSTSPSQFSEIKNVEQSNVQPNHSENNFGLGNPIDQEIILGPLDFRLAQLQVPGFDFQPVVRPFTLDPDFPITRSPRKFFWYVGVSGGYAPRSIEINQAQTVSRIQIADAGNSLQSGFANLSFMVQNEIKPWVRSFASIKLGLLQHSINMTETSKEPVGYQMSTTDSINYTMVPLYANSFGSFRQDIFFGNAEFGLNPILFPSRQSGPFASVVVWASIKQSVSSSLQGTIAGWENSTDNVALSYRLGYGHTFSGTWRAEIFTAGLPDKILANSKGLSIKPQLFGIGIHYQIR